MRVSVRAVLSVLGVAFTAYLAAGGLAWRGMAVVDPLLLIAMACIYLATAWLCIFWHARPSATDSASVLTAGLGRHSVLPGWAAAVALIVTAVIPSVTWYAAGPDARLEPFATWSLGGLSALMAIVMVRRRPWVAWSGVVLLTVAGTVWIGLVNALSLGAVGAVVWVGVAQLVTMLVDRAARDTAELTEVQRHASEWLASQEGRRRERRVQVWRALTVAGPVLARTIETGGELDDEERMQARLAEGSLRDELRGRGLLDDDVRRRLESARRRGASVTVLDEGGLDGLDEHAVQEIRAELARTLDQAHSDRLYIRTSPHEGIAVTVVGRSRPDDDADGEESVDLWHEIARPQTD
ncbi:hypothetical protein [Microbacterium sp.]|uniref:hypothetical protein n=1 Tax=Microbacterium sp. TaxID=51671 RepID=UPI0039E6C214